MPDMDHSDKLNSLLDNNYNNEMNEQESKISL